jgi:hypothetical protein
MALGIVVDTRSVDAPARGMTTAIGEPTHVLSHKAADDAVALTTKAKGFVRLDRSAARLLLASSVVRPPVPRVP